MQNWLAGLLSVTNLVAITFRRAENVVDAAEGDGRSFSRYMVVSIAGLAVIGAVAAGTYYFWPSDPVAVDESARTVAAPKTADQHTRTQISYVDGISLEADVAARSVPVTSSFRGAEIILFGAVDDTRYTATANRPFDVVVAVEGREEPVVMRKKSNIAGMWINTEAVRFNNVPSFYAVHSTRPLEEIAEADLYRRHKIGIANILGAPVANGTGLSKTELNGFADALRRLKQESGLYVEDDSGVSFTGRVLFRSKIDLPPSVLVGNLIARVYLFRDGELLANFTSDIRMERQGLMRYMHQLAFTYQLAYGILAVVLAAVAGIGASMLFRKKGH